MLFLIFSFAGTLLFDVLFDWYGITQLNRKVKHTLETFGAAALYIGLVAWAILKEGVGYADAAAFCIVFIPVRWLWHDLLLNIVRGLPFDYLGSEQHAAFTDKLLRRLALKNVNQWVVKFSALFVCLLIGMLIQFFFNNQVFRL